MSCESLIINGIEYVKKQEVSKDICIVRTYSAGVFFGQLMSRQGKEGKIKNARRLWQWSGAASLSQLAVEGTKNPNQCKFPVPVPEIILTEIIEVIPCTETAIKSIEAVPIWKM